MSTIASNLKPAGRVTLTWTRTNPSGRPVGTTETVEVFRDARQHGALVIRSGASVAPFMIVRRFADVKAA